MNEVNQIYQRSLGQAQTLVLVIGLLAVIALIVSLLPGNKSNK